MSDHDHDPALLTAGLIATGVVAVSFSAPIWRNALGAAAGAPYTLTSRRQELASLVRHQRGTLGAAVLAGLLLAVHFGLWIPSLRLTSVTASRALLGDVMALTGGPRPRARGHRVRLRAGPPARADNADAGVRLRRLTERHLRAAFNPEHTGAKGEPALRPHVLAPSARFRIGR